MIETVPNRAGSIVTAECASRLEPRDIGPQGFVEVELLFMHSESSGSHQKE